MAASNARAGARSIVLAALAALVFVACSPAATTSPNSAVSSPVGSGTISQPSASGSSSASLLEARLEGTFVVTRTVSAESGLDFLYKVGEVQTRVYEATPSCPSGPCDTSIVVTTPGAKSPFTFTVAWKAGTYSYEAIEPNTGFLCHQNGKPYHSKDTVTTVVLRPSEAEGLPGAILATKLDLATYRYEVRPDATATKAGCQPQTADLTGTAERTTDVAAVLAGPSTTGGPRPATDLEPAASCADEKTARAKASTATVKFTLTNNTTSLVTLFYLDEHGKRHKQYVLNQSGDIEQQTTKGQPWVVADDAGRCLLLFNGANKSFELK